MTALGEADGVSPKSATLKSGGVSSKSTATKIGQRKHGRIVAHILDAFAADPDAALTVADIAMQVYGVRLFPEALTRKLRLKRLYEGELTPRQASYAVRMQDDDSFAEDGDQPAVTKAHRVAVLQAMRRVSELDQRFQLRDGGGPQGQVNIFDVTRPLSYGLSWLKAEELYRYQWTGLRAAPDQASEDELRAKLAPGGRWHEAVKPGGGWWRDCQAWAAHLDGDTATAEGIWAELEVERDEAMRRMVDALDETCRQCAPGTRRAPKRA